MTSHYRLKNIEIDHADQISLKVQNKAVDLIYQYPYSASVLSDGIYASCVVRNIERICGKPTKFPNYGNFPEIFAMKTHGPEISISPWQNEVHRCSRWIENYIDIYFFVPVYPIKISMYEVYNPGNIIEIWAQNYDNLKEWFLLWNGSRQIVPLTSRVFSPSLKTCNFKTTRFQLRIKHSMLNDHIMIDAVMLIGSRKLISSKNSKHRLTIKYNLLKRINRIHTDLCHKDNRDIRKIVDQSNSKDNKVSRKEISNYKHRQRNSNCLVLKNCLNFNCKNLQLTANKELSHYSLSSFPDEIILKILKNLDLLTLCRISQVDKRFNELTRERLLYTRLNMRYMCERNISDKFCYFTPRYEYLKQLDLTGSSFRDLDFVQFLENCGSHLTHLRLTYCPEINDLMLFNISTICRDLKVLDLTGVKCGFSYLKNLENVEYLNLSDMYINNENDIKHLCEMLQRNQRMRELNLTRLHTRKLKGIIKELRNSCQDLKIINLRGIRNISSEDINDLSGCKNLRKLNLTIDGITDNSWCKLFSSCQCLEEICLFGKIQKYELKFLTCKNLIKLYLNIYYDDFFLTSDDFFILYSVIFKQCPKLQELHTTDLISDNLINQWKLMYPDVSVCTKCNCICKIY